MTLEEYITKYENRTKEKFEPSKGFKLFYFPDRGFCEMSVIVQAKMVIARQMCGDALFWRQAVELICMVAGYTHAGTYCIRHVKPYIRLFGFHIDRTEDTPEGTRYFCTDNNGKHGQCSPAWITSKGERAYYITWEV